MLQMSQAANNHIALKGIEPISLQGSDSAQTVLPDGDLCRRSLSKIIKYRIRKSIA